MPPPPTQPGPRLAEAFAYARDLHHGQVRKGLDGSSGTPYVAHLLAVTALVLEHGGDEEEAIAALLHDGPEDQGGRATLEEIRERFGARVAAIVESLSDTLEEPKPPWIERKQAYVRHLEEGGTSDSALLVSLADKTHNVGSIVEDYRRVGERVWERFAGGRDGTLWYYRTLRDVFLRVAPPRARPLAARLERSLSQLEDLMAAAGPS